MPRPRRYDRRQLIARAMERFWWHGYEATSVEDLVQVTGVSRHGLYAEFDGKGGLFLACLDAYRESVVTPAFGAVEAEGAGLSAITGYLEQQIARAITVGLPGPGCLLANTMTEIAPHDAQIEGVIDAHLTRLRQGFNRALRHAAGADSRCTAGQLDDLAWFLTVSAQGLWSVSRTVRNPAALFRFAAMLDETVKARLGQSVDSIGPQ